MSDVFISYKRENLAAVSRLVAALRAEGVGVWWDQDIPPNAAWEATIEAALAAARVVVVAWSPAAVASENVKAEARQARQQGRLLQVFVEACEPPLFFGERQGVDLKHWSGAATDPAFRRVLEAVRRGLLQPAPSSDEAPSPQAVAAADTPPPLPSKPSIAVLPFANLSGDPEQEYFADGMVVEISNALSRFKSIFVIASGSSLALKGKGASPKDAARLLGVRYILEGSVRKSGSRLRIAVQLVDADGGAQVWTQRFDETIDDVFEIQDKVALSVAGAIEPTLRASEMRRASGRPTDNLGSYDLFLRALSIQRTYTERAQLEAIDLLNRAIELDPEYGAALAQVAFGHFIVSNSQWSDDVDFHERSAVEAAHRAVRATGDDPAVLAVAAFVMSRAGQDQGAAVALIDRAIALNPGSSSVWGIGGIVRVGNEGVDLAIEHIQTALRLDPLGPDRAVWTGWIGIARFQQGRFQEAAANLREWTQAADVYIAHGFLAASYGHLGQIGAAKEALEDYRRTTLRPITELASSFPDQTLRRLFKEGIDLAEGRSAPASGEASP
jgi:TolB-like protein/tetratricopeptide (TPR) repeat protein